MALLLILIKGDFNQFHLYTETNHVLQFPIYFSFNSHIFLKIFIILKML